MSLHAPLRIALFGGSFDPVHAAHVAIADAAVKQARLDKVIFLPAAKSPLKAYGPEACGSRRIKMLELALDGLTWAEISRWELDQPGPSYSWQTVQHFRNGGGAGHEWFWLLGVDQWEQLQYWQNWEQLAQWVTFLVFARGGVKPQPKCNVRAVFLSGGFPGSSTEVRTARRLGNPDWAGGLPPAVADYIRQHQLYHGSSAGGGGGKVL